MKLKTILAATLLGISSFAAQAFTIQAGDYKMTVDAYTNGTIYGFTGTCGGNTTSAANIDACDAATIVAPSVGSTAPEDTWGILSIATIRNTATNTDWFTRGTNGFIIGSFTGLTDFRVTSDGIFQQELATGGTIKLFASAFDYDPTFATNPTTDQAGVLASVVNLPLWLELNFVQGVGSNATTGSLNATYSGSFNQDTGAVSGIGFLEVIDGAEKVRFDSNGLTTGAGRSADARFSVTSFALLPTDPNYDNWLVLSTAQVTGSVIPEPGSLALAGLGLMGLAALRRRKQA